MKKWGLSFGVILVAGVIVYLFLFDWETKPLAPLSSSGAVSATVPQAVPGLLEEDSVAAPPGSSGEQEESSEEDGEGESARPWPAGNPPKEAVRSSSVVLSTGTHTRLVLMPQVPPLGFLQPTTGDPLMVFPYDGRSEMRLELFGDQVLLEHELLGLVVRDDSWDALSQRVSELSFRPQVLVVVDSLVDSRVLTEVSRLMTDRFFLVLQNCLVDDVSGTEAGVLSRIRGLVIQEGTVSGAFWSQLPRFVGLEGLAVVGTDLADQDWSRISGLPSVTHLWLDARGLSRDGLLDVTRFRGLRFLLLGSESLFRGELIAGLRELVNLSALGLTGKIESGSLARLAGSGSLTGLYLAPHVGVLGEENGLALGELPSLTVLHAVTSLSPQAFLAVQRLSGLRSLAMGWGLLPGSLLPGLAAFPDLRHLVVMAAQDWTDDWAARFPALAHIEFLLLDAPSVTDVGLAHVLSGMSLRHLTVYSPSVSGTGLAGAVARSPLQSLDMSRTSLSDAGLAVLGGGRTLETLSIGGRSVSAEGMASLCGLVALRHLSLYALDAHGATLMPLGCLARLTSIVLPEKARLAGHGDWLAHLKEVTSLSLMGTEVDGGLLAFVGQMEALQSLSLAGLPFGGDEMRSLTSLQKLTFLDMRKTELTDEGLRWVGEMQGLRTLLVSETGISDDGMFALRHLDGLQRLDLSRTYVSGEGLRHIADLRSLSHLDLSHSTVRSGSLAHLRQLTSLTHVLLEGTGIGDDGLAALSGLPRLAQLAVDVATASGDGFSGAGAYPSLHSLRLSGARLTGAGTAAIASIQSLRRLALVRSGIDDASLGALGALTGLLHLDLSENDLVGTGLNALGAIPRLRTLRMDCVSFSAEGLLALTGLGQVRDLSLGSQCAGGAARQQIRDDDLAVLAKSRGLGILRLSQQGITGSGFAALSKMPRLWSLHLSGCPVRDEFLGALWRIPTLRSVTLSMTAVTDVGLNGIPAEAPLENIVLTGAGVTQVGLTALQTRLPDIRIHWRDMGSP